jgi:hypothetical protein
MRTLRLIVFALAVAELSTAQMDPAIVRQKFQTELAQAQARIAATPDRIHWFDLGAAAHAAYELGDSAAAEDFANRALGPLATATPFEMKFFTGQAAYDGHWVLGMIALDHGDVELAREELLAAGKSIGSPVLGSFGPNLRLAYNLLTRKGAGEPDQKAVVEFLRECSVFWHVHELSEWEAQVAYGKVPDFRDMLYR